MRVIVTSERRLKQTPDGNFWTQTSSVSYTFWTRYLDVFDEVLVVSRSEPVAEAEPSWKPVNGPQVSVLPLPGYVGPVAFLRTQPLVLGALYRAIQPDDAIILRVPSHVATSVEWVARAKRQRFAAEVVGDVDAALSPESVSHPLRPLLHFMGVRTVRRQCRNACAVSYVTARTLQQKYPPAPDAFTTHYSSITLPDALVVDEPRTVQPGKPLDIISVGSMELRYKRFDNLIEAVVRAVAQGLDLRLTLIGDGQQRPFFEGVAQGLGQRVRFLGELPGSQAVRDHLEQADLFVLPSVSEGLPRVVIEAMAAGLPCIATDVGGTRELIDAEWVVPPSDVAALATAIEKASQNPARLRAMSARNLAVAKQYTESQLRERRRALYQSVRTQINQAG